MKYITSFLLPILLISFELFSQVQPKNYSFESNKLSKNISETPIGNSINDIITVGDTIWIATGRGLSKSTNRGNTWINYYNDPAFGSEGIFSIAYFKGIICAATGHTKTVNEDDLPEGSGIRISFDGGETWRSFPQSVDADGDSSIIYGINKMRALPITTAINNVSYDVAITTNYIWTANFAGGLRRARIDSLLNNNNYKWERIILPPDGRADSLITIRPTEIQKFSLQPVAGKFGSEDHYNHRVFSVMAVDDKTIYAGTAGGLNVSTDGGVVWTKMNYKNQASPISGNWVVSIAYNYINKSIWATSWITDKEGEFNSLNFSTDNGNSWKNTLLDEKLYDIDFKDEEILSVSDKGAFRSNNMGASWLSPNSIVDKLSRLSLNTNSFYSAASQGNDIWLGSDVGLAKITETGSMWEGDWKIYLASQPLADKEDTYAFPNPFSPDVESVKIKYSTHGQLQNVTIRIFDFGMNLVKTVIQNAERGNPIHSVDGSNLENNGVIDYWDGRDEKGSIVPNGVYFYRVDLESGDPVFGKIMVLM